MTPTPVEVPAPMSIDQPSSSRHTNGSRNMSRSMPGGAPAIAGTASLTHVRSPSWLVATQTDAWRMPSTSSMPVYRIVGVPSSSMTVQPDQHPNESGPVGSGVRAIGQCSQWMRSSLTA